MHHQIAAGAADLALSCAPATRTGHRTLPWQQRLPHLDRVSQPIMIRQPHLYYYSRTVPGGAQRGGVTWCWPPRAQLVNLWPSWRGSAER
jgi:hypothetical protein